MQSESDLDLWREYQKGADEAWERVAEQEYWYYLALDEWEYQDAQKDARVAAAAALRAAEAREQAQLYRAGIMMYYETELEGLMDTMYGAEEEMDTYAGLMDSQTYNSSPWEYSYGEYEYFEQEYYEA